MIGKTNNGGGGTSVVSIEVTHAPTKTSYKDGENLNLTGMIVTATMTDGTTKAVTDYTTIPANGSVLHEGTTSVTVSYRGCIATVEIEVKPDVEIKPFASATDAEIVAMAQALQDGTISVSDLGWSIGQERTITSGTYTNKHLVIYHLGSAGIKFTDGTDVHVVVGFKEVLKTSQYHGSSNAYGSSTLKTEENNIYKALPSTIKPAFKQFKAKTAENGNSSTVTGYDVYMSSPAEKEIFGSRSYSVSAEANVLTQFDYFKTENNRIKQLNGSNSSWWGRSPSSGDTGDACRVVNNGGAGSFDVSFDRGVSPFGCF